MTAVFETAVAGLIRRVDGTLAESEGRFPVYAGPESGVWTWADDGDWTGDGDGVIDSGRLS